MVDCYAYEYEYIFVVCFAIELKVVGATQHKNSTMLAQNSTVKWELGRCSSLNSIANGATYQYPAIYTERCCLEPGRYTLVCYNFPPAQGWKNAHLTIEGHRYCDNFASYVSYQKISIAGKNIQSIYTYTCVILNFIGAD